MKKYPDIRMEQLVTLMLCRGDMSRSEARQVRVVALSWHD